MKKLVAFLLVLCMIFTTACGASDTGEANMDTNTSADSDAKPSESGEKVTIRFGHSQPDTHPYQFAAEEFKAYLEENAPEPVNVELYPNGALGGEREMTEALQLGSLEITIAPGSILSFAPEMGVFGLPYIFENREHAYKVLDGEIGTALGEGLPDKGLHLLSYWENGFRQITNSKRPIYEPEDLAGIKIRVPENNIYVDTFAQLGANVTSMAFGEVFTALQQGTIDAEENSFALVASNKFWEVQKYLSVSNHVYEPAHVLISESFWSELSPEMQAAVQEAADYARDYMRDYLTEKDEEYIALLKENGMEVNEVDTEAFIEAVQPVWDKYRTDFGDVIDQITAMK